VTLRLLLVEDEQLNRTLVKAILARAGDERLRTAQLREADTLAAARRMLAEGPVDIVLLDVQLPDGSGLTLARELAEVPLAQRPTILALTAGALPEQHEAALAAGCDAVLIKPYTVEEFEAVLASHITSPA
jgi:two-component system KDP operon response regulator KdpE